MLKRSESQWKQELSEEEYRVCRQKETERPFTGELLNTVLAGEYLCKCCGSRLFLSTDKFDSGCGWPSFSAESTDMNIEYIQDNSHGMQRVEITCKHCDAHLGHVFNDGPGPSGQRYCVNSVSISFKEKNN